MNKTIMYQQVPVRGEFRNVILAGESLYDYPRTLGSDYLELLVCNHDDNGYSTVGIPEDYNFTRLYHEDGNWSPALLADAINSGTGYVHHAGHANADYVAGWNGMSITDSYFQAPTALTTTLPFSILTAAIVEISPLTAYLRNGNYIQLCRRYHRELTVWVVQRRTDRRSGMPSSERND